MILEIANFIAAFGAAIGIALLAHKRKSGFFIFFGVELCMFYIGYMTDQYGVLAMSVIYFFFNIYGYYQWSKS